MSSSRWSRLALLGCGATVVSGLLYYLLRETTDTREPSETKTTAEEEDSQGKKNLCLSADTITKDEFVELLNSLISSQDSMKAVLKNLIQSFRCRDITFHDAYQEARTKQLKDPLETSGLSAMDFDGLILKFHHDPEVAHLVGRIMGIVPATSTPESSAAESFSVDTIVSIHATMLQEIKQLADELRNSFNSSTYDLKTVTLAVQALVGSRIEKQFNVTYSDLEAAILRHHETLGKNSEFVNINHEIELAMSSLVGLYPQ